MIHVSPSSICLLGYSYLGGIVVLIHIMSPVTLFDVLRCNCKTILDESDDASFCRIKVVKEGFSLTLLDGELDVDIGVNLGEVHVHGDGLGDVGEDEGGGKDRRYQHIDKT